MPLFLFSSCEPLFINIYLLANLTKKISSAAKVIPAGSLPGSTFDGAVLAQAFIFYFDKFKLRAVENIQGFLKEKKFLFRGNLRVCCSLRKNYLLEILNLNILAYNHFLMSNQSTNTVKCEEFSKAEQIICLEERDVDYIHYPKHKINMQALFKKKGWEGKWSGKEEVKYVKFLQKHLEIMECKASRKKHKIFNEMAKWMRTRNSEQCRSHHQKKLHYHQSIRNIISHYHEVIFRRMENYSENRRVTKPQLLTPLPHNIPAQDPPFYSLQKQGTTIHLQIDAQRIQGFSLW